MLHRGRATIRGVTDYTNYSVAEAAQRAGVDEAFINRLKELGILKARPGDRLTAADIRGIRLGRTLDTAGIPLDGVGAMMRRGELSLDFLETPTYERFAALSNETFASLAERTHVPLELLMVMREATGSAIPQPGAYVREDEREI